MKNIYTQSELVPDWIDGTYPPTREQLMAAGWREVPELPPLPDGYTRIAAKLVEGDGVTGAWQVTDRPTADIEAEARSADLAANGTRYALQNEYLALCDQLTGGTAHAKLGFEQLEGIIRGLMQTAPQTAVALSLQLLTLNAALVREGGINWWDNCVWTEGVTP